MAKWTNDLAMDAMLDFIALGNVLHVCSSQPADRAAAIAASLADIALTPGAGNGDFTLANGDASGRKLTVAAQNGVTIDANGTATHVAIIDGTNLLVVTTVASQALVAAGTVDIGAWDIEVADPT